MKASYVEQSVVATRSSTWTKVFPLPFQKGESQGEGLCSPNSCRHKHRHLQMKLKLLFCFVLTALFIMPNLHAAFLDDWAKMKSIVPQGYVCHRAPSTITIDGRLDEASWQAVPWTKDFVDIEGDAKPKPRFRTRAKMLWNDNYF